MLAATVNLMAHDPAKRVAEVAHHAEELGFSRCWVYDEGLGTRDVYVVLTAVALATERVMIGPGITNPYSRHPGATASAIASLDEVSGGRAFLGLGAGGGMTMGPLALDRPAPAATVEEMVIAVRGLVAGERVDADGEVVRFRQASLEYGRPDLEIWVAGRGPLMHDVAGRVADGFHLSFTPKATLGDSVDRLDAAASGRSVRRSYSTMLVTDEDQIEEARRQISFRVPDSPGRVKDLLGADSALVADLRAALARGGPAAAGQLVPDEWLDHFVIRGTVAECAVELAELAAVHALDEFQIPVLHLDGAEHQLATAMEVVERANAVLT